MRYLFGREGPVVHEGNVRGLREIGVVEQGGVAFVDGLGQVHVTVEQHEREVLVAEVLAQRTSLFFCGGGAWWVAYVSESKNYVHHKPAKAHAFLSCCAWFGARWFVHTFTLFG